MQWQILLVLFSVIRSVKVAAPRDSGCAEPLYFKCHNTSKCISHIFVCDNEDDCGDNSDEDPDKCRKQLPSLADVCKEHEFQCADRLHCIPEDDYCDGKQDCIDGSDEAVDCHVNKACNGYKCMSGQCIPRNWRCDGQVDCIDVSDELNCSMKSTQSTNCTSTIEKYLCANRRCIDLALTCNNIDNCGDNSDESPSECNKAEEACASPLCSSKCRPTQHLEKLNLLFFAFIFVNYRF